MTDTKANSFSYSTEEGKHIVVSDSLLAEVSPHEVEDRDYLYSDLKRLSEKDIRLHWHTITLSDYWREKRIPRGLRIKKFPSFGIEDIAFREKWEAILNKCSLDLILLIIEKTKKEREQVQERIRELREETSKVKDDIQTIPFEDKLKESLEKFTMELKQYKLKKFKRDERDYKDGNVYQWKETIRPQRRKRLVSFNLSTSGEESDVTHMSEDFLEDQPHSATRGRQSTWKGGGRRRKRPEEGEVGQVLQKPRWNLRNQKKNAR